MARDKFHFLVRTILENEGWTISHDPYFIRLGKRKGFVDLGAERTILGAEKEGEKIAVEIKSFLGLSEVDQFEDALGQILLYRPALKKIEPDRILWLALPYDIYSNLFDDSYFQEIAELYELKMIVYDEKNKTIVSWKK
jgi:XisH protein